jgi:fructose-1,6-bisphosphatase
MSYLVEQAGGLALTGKNRIMKLIPKNVHQRVPCFLGSTEDIKEMKSYYDKCTDPAIIARCNSRL